MDINNLEKNNSIELDNKISIQTQKNFLESTLGKTINTALDIGIRTILPDFIENEVINIKNNLFNYGLKDGISKTIDDAIDIGKSAIGIITGNFENVSQMQRAIQNGGLIDGISSLLDTVVDKVRQKGILKPSIAKTIKQGKNIILNNVENNIQKNFDNQYKSIDNVNNYIEQWRRSFKSKDFESMDNAYRKMEKQLKEIAPIEKIINNAKSVEILHELIKNNGRNFNLTDEQMNLAKNLI